MNIRLLNDKVLVLPVETETKTQAGIIIPTQAKERPNEGQVKVVGPGSKEEPMLIKVDDRVIYGKHAGSAISFEGKEYLIMRQSDILAVL